MKDKPNQPWVRLDLEDTNPSIRGNVEGLKHLRNKIDEALLGNVALMEDFDCDFNQIEVTEYYPEKEKGFWSRVFELGCGFIGFLILVLGLITLVVLATFAYKLLTIH